MSALDRLTITSSDDTKYRSASGTKRTLCKPMSAMSEERKFAVVHTIAKKGDLQHDQHVEYLTKERKHP